MPSLSDKQLLGDIGLMIGIVGYGVLGKQLYSLARLDQRPDKIVVFDDFAESSAKITAEPFSRFASSVGMLTEVYVGIGYKHMRLRAALIETALVNDVAMPPLIHKSSVVASSAVIGSAAYLYAGGLIDENVVICDGAILNNRVTVSHDTIIGESTFLAPGVVVCGNVRIGRRTFIGAGTVITNDIEIGDDVVIGAGSLVSRDVENGQIVVGNPMRIASSVNVR